MIDNEARTQIQIAYIHGRLEAQIEAFAISVGIPYRQLAERLAALLCSEEGGKVLGTVDRVSSVPRKAKGHKTLAKVEVAERPHRKAYKISKAARKRMSEGQKKHWANKKAA